MPPPLPPIIRLLTDTTNARCLNISGLEAVTLQSLLINKHCTKEKAGFKKIYTH